MKNIQFKTLFYIIFGLATVILVEYYILSNTQKEEVHDHGAEHKTGGEKNEHSTISKEVELNEAQFKASAIELGTFSKKNLSEVINANGYTELPPQNQADVSVHLTGVVSKINVIEGQRVTKGQVLAVVESPEFAKLQEAYATSNSNLEFLKQEYERQKTLSEENVNSKKVFQRTKADYEAEKARFASLGKQLSLLNLNSSSATASMPVIAPISGYITNVNIKIGSNAEVGKPLLSIVDNSKLHVDLLVYEKDLGKVKPGQTIRFVLTNQDNKEIKGKVFNISQSFENETKSVAVHADIENPGSSLISGMYVNALIDVGANAVQALPNEAVVKADGREYIFILDEGHDKHKDAHDETEGHSQNDTDSHENEGTIYNFKRIEVKTGTSQLGYTQITVVEPLQKNAKIVLKGAYYIQSHLIKNAGGGGHAH
ncbi:efflux RND transporter periplasmic adaptor subunit [Flavobacterium sp. Sd200]|uniref:efflux RND transporter periplasmic adaptor subunit n=1 Tax=Flavobacterium sp. Sd200 TaxID=2692211 RepID=UPI00136CFF50|nr:efflux RND transporter periplasmic adaptor subunit [Flavobacterium sp. Sd200]MXN90748.1 efflux RND transporter periplasmic adaptor subunit [Flavobacterium sp. Sd200]